MEDIQSGGEAPVEAEVRDIRSCIQAMELKVNEIEVCFTSLRGELQRISELAQRQENMEMEAEASSQLLTTEKLSQTAKMLLDQPGWPPRFTEFLLDDSFGKPKPSILPIVRSYTPSGSAEEIREMVKYLQDFDTCLRQAHNDYKEERRKDMNLENRIKRLVSNIERELVQEGRDGMQQTSMSLYLTRN